MWLYFIFSSKFGCRLTDIAECLNKFKFEDNCFLPVIIIVIKCFVEILLLGGFLFIQLGFLYFVKMPRRWQNILIGKGQSCEVFCISGNWPSSASEASGKLFKKLHYFELHFRPTESAFGGCLRTCISELLGWFYPTELTPAQFYV